MQRIRTRDQSITTDLSLKRWAKQTNGVWDMPSWGVPVAYGQPGPRTYSLLDTCNDSTTPGFFKARREGEFIPINPFASVQRKLYPGGPWTCRSVSRGAAGPFNWNQLHMEGPVLWDLRPPVSQSYSTQINANLALIEARAKLKTSQWDVLTFLAEWTKTRDLVFGAAKRYRELFERVLDEVKRRRRRGNSGLDVAGLTREFSQLWMEGRYGWRILYYDLLSIERAMRALEEGGLGMIRKYHMPSPAVSEQIGSNFSVYGVQNHYFRWRTQTTESVRAFSIGEVFNNAPISVDPIVTLYEVTMWSFIADWLINVGSNLRAFSPFAHASVKGEGFTRVIERISILEPVPLDPGAYYLLEFKQPDPAVYIHRSTTRTPQFAKAELALKWDVSAHKIVDVLALAALVKYGPLRLLQRAGGRG